ncbi:MAG TPA: TolC family protein [Anaeromyxobacteraceae bacterium]|nr:TolC family protein [Anaeromyxobacteraceae bacterium]
MRPKRTALAPAAALMAAALAAPAPGRPADGEGAAPAPLESLPALLTLPEALRLLREHSLDLASASAAVNAAKAQVHVAGAVPNPEAGFTYGKSWQCQGAPGCEQPYLNGTLSDQGALAFLATGQRGLAVGAAEQSVKAAEASRDDALRNATFQLKQQFVNTAIAQRALEFTREEARLAGETVALARRRLEAGAISDADLARLEVLGMQIEQAADRADQAFQQAKAALGLVLGLRRTPADFRVEGPEISSALLPPRLAGATLASLAGEAREHRPDVAAARAQLEQARLAASLARRQLIPQFALQLAYYQQGSSTGYTNYPTGTVGITLPLPVFYQQQGQIGQADAAVWSAEVALARAEALVASDVAAAFSAMTSARSAALRAEHGLLKRSRDARDLVNIQYTKGAASLLDLLDAERTHISNQIDYLQSLSAYWVAVFQLEQAVGASYLP